MTRMMLHYAARSDRGLIREANEDSVYAGARLLAVADGMGGMAAGEVASNIVISTLSELDEDAPPADAVETLQSSILSANIQLRSSVEQNPELEGMGTTLTAMLFTGSSLVLAHVGDSRAYLWRDEELTQITRDDTYVQMLVDEGRITAEEAQTHPQRSLLTRALDGRDVEPDTSVRPALVGDRYMLCSDGLCGVVSSETIADALVDTTPDEAADRLVQLALRGGGPDNITVIVADVVETDAIDDDPVVGGAASLHREEPTVRETQTPAQRAAALTQPEERGEREREEDASEESPKDEVTGEQPGKSRISRFWRWLTGGVIVVAVLGILGGGAWYYTQQQYYIGSTDDGTVAIFRGVEGSLIGVEFSHVVEKSDMSVDDLEEVARQEVEATVWAKSRKDAEEQLRKLRDQRIPVCPDSHERQSAATGASTTACRSAMPLSTPSYAETSYTDSISSA